MIKLNFLNTLYKQSPMDFYTYTGEKHTLIKSINEFSRGYEFKKEFSREEINAVWKKTRLYKRTSAILIFLFFILLLYGIIFPNFSHFVNNLWYINAIIILAFIAIVCSIISTITSVIFEKNLLREFGEFEKTKFIQSDKIDDEYYKLFKVELTKVLVFITLVCATFGIISPFHKTEKLIEQGNYKKAIQLTNVGISIFPIAQEWYSLRAYAKYKTQDYQGAIKDFDKAYKLGADGANIMNFDNKIYIKYIMGEYNSALEDFDNEINNADNDYEKDSFLWDKAQFLYNIKNYNEALEIYNELIVKAENDRIFLLKDRLYLERAEVYKQLGQENLAQEDLINAGALTSNSEIPAIPKPVLIIDEI